LFSLHNYTCLPNHILFVKAGFHFYSQARYIIYYYWYKMYKLFLFYSITTLLVGHFCVTSAFFISNLVDTDNQNEIDDGGVNHNRLKNFQNRLAAYFNNRAPVGIAFEPQQLYVDEFGDMDRLIKSQRVALKRTGYGMAGRPPVRG